MMKSAGATDARNLQAEILHALLRGRAPDLTELQQNRSPDEVLRGWNELVQRGAVVLGGSGKVVAAYPLSAIQTKHRVEVGPFTAWANCAIDALAVPHMVGQSARIISECAHCGTEIIIEVEGETVRGVPADTVVGYGGLADCCDRPAIEARCPYINFFCNMEHAGFWTRPDSWVGEFLSLPQAAAIAAEWAPLVSAPAPVDASRDPEG